jgi:hypothetical protein
MSKAWNIKTRDEKRDERSTYGHLGNWGASWGGGIAARGMRGDRNSRAATNGRMAISSGGRRSMSKGAIVIFVVAMIVATHGVAFWVIYCRIKSNLMRQKALAESLAIFKTEMHFAQQDLKYRPGFAARCLANDLTARNAMLMAVLDRACQEGRGEGGWNCGRVYRDDHGARGAGFQSVVLALWPLMDTPAAIQQHWRVRQKPDAQLHQVRPNWSHMLSSQHKSYS